MVHFRQCAITLYWTKEALVSLINALLRNRDGCVGRCYGIALLNRLLASLWKLTMLNVARLVFSVNRRLGF